MNHKKREKEMHINQTKMKVWEIFRTVEAFDILTADTLYKEGFNDCLKLIRAGLRKHNI